MQVLRTSLAGLLVLLASASAFSPSSSVVGRNRIWQPVSRLPINSQRPAAMRLGALRMDGEVPTTPKEALTGTTRKSDRKMAVQDKVMVIGLSHKTASVDVREKLAVQEHDWQKAAHNLCTLSSIKEAAVISTCNRFELYLVTDNIHAGVREVTENLSKRSGVDMRELRDSLFMLSEEEAVWHALRVSSGLDSLVIGEGQILSQMKRCYELASDPEGAAGKVLTRMLNTAVSAGKRVRSETGIARGGVSISSAAVELVESKCLDDLALDMTQLDIAIIGAGKMARLLVQHLTPRGVKSITIVNRSPGRVEELMEMFPDSPIKLALLPEMEDIVGSSHVTFACTGAMEPIIRVDNLENKLKRDVMLVDISVPRNIDDKELNKLAQVKAYNVDDLKAVVAANQARRQRLVLEAEELLEEEKETFGTWQASLGTVPMITKLQGRAETIRRAELGRVERKLTGLSAQERETVERLTKGIVAKLLHGPMSHLRTMDGVDGDRTATVKSLEKMFRL